MIQQLHTCADIDTDFSFLFICFYSVYCLIAGKIKVKVRTGSNVKSYQTSQTYIIFQIDWDIKAILLNSSFFASIRDFYTSLSKKQRRIYTQSYYRKADKRMGRNDS